MFSIVHPQTDIKVKEKIWAKNFVDLATLLPNTQAGETKTTTKDGNREVTTVSRLGPKRIVNLTTWYQAFQIYADIYCQKYPTQSPNLFRYMSIIQKMAVSYKQWLSYDEKFRQMKATKSLPWDSIHTETYLFCSLSASNTQTFRPQPSATTRLPLQILRRRGYCWDFQSRGLCFRPNCQILHRCANCEGPHGTHACFKPPHTNLNSLLLYLTSVVITMAQQARSLRLCQDGTCSH